MRIVVTGGGTGGHFYPVIAVVQALNDEVSKQNLLPPDIYYLAPEPYDKRALFENGAEYRHVSAGKMRTYFSVKNFFDIFKTAWGMLRALFKVFSIYPDVIFAKGGYASFPVLFAARILRIPVVIHESDTVPGRVNKWASSFARAVAVSYPQASEHFKGNNVVYTGHPIRKEVMRPALSGADSYLHLDEDIPTLLILGGSQGAATINGIVLDALPRLVKSYYVIHQTGADHLESVRETSNLVLDDLPVDEEYLKDRYKPFAFLNPLALRMAAGASDVVISRAGSTIFEIAAWGVPSILIPLDSAHADHQKKNAYAYARSGAAIVIEESNLSDDIVINQLESILSDEDKYTKMVKASTDFASYHAADKIAQKLIDIAREHD